MTTQLQLSPVFFYLFAGLAIACSLMVVFKKNPVSSAFSLVLVFFSFAGIYALLQAHLIAALQILVYTGAIMVLFIFVIMLLNADVPSFDLTKKTAGPRAFLGVLGTIFLAFFFIWAFRNSDVDFPRGPFSPEAVEAAGGNTRVLSELLFSEYILPFELTSILLLAAMIGTVVIAIRHSKSSSRKNTRASKAKPLGVSS